MPFIDSAFAVRLERDGTRVEPERYALATHESGTQSSN